LARCPEVGGWLILAAGALVGSTISGVAGLGAAIIMIPVIARTLGGKATVPFMTVAMLIGNLPRAGYHRAKIRLEL
jgi:uncharacterized membrane protein YfcA